VVGDGIFGGSLVGFHSCSRSPFARLDFRLLEGLAGAFRNFSRWECRDSVHDRLAESCKSSLASRLGFLALALWSLFYIDESIETQRNKMLMEMLRENLGLFLPKNRLVDSCFADALPNQQAKYGKKDGLESVGSGAITAVDSEYSSSSFESDESIEIKWNSPVREKKTRNVSKTDNVSDCNSDEVGFPMLSTRGSRNLPTSSWYYSSNHIMVNNERRRNNVHPLTRKSSLDETARWHAENMAAANYLHHAVPDELQRQVGRPCRIIGVNVYRGESVRAIHNKMMESPSDVRNMLDLRYVQFGMGTARGPEGDLFLCQVFIG
jgi:Cysteine-rich secretory protein family